MALYRIAFVADSQAHSVVRDLAVGPKPGDELALDSQTVVAVREVIKHLAGDTITAEIIADAVPAPGSTTGSESRNSR